MALVVVVLTIAAVNVASVTLARGLARQPELATRRALGAGPMRLLGHLFAENAVIVVGRHAAGRGAGRVDGAPSSRGFITLSYQTVEVVTAPSLRIAGHSSAASTRCCSWWSRSLPAYRLVRRRAALPVTTRWASDAPSALRTLRTMVVIQLALALLLVTAAGLFVQTLARLSTARSGLPTRPCPDLESGRREPIRDRDGRRTGTARGALPRSRVQAARDSWRRSGGFVVAWVLRRKRSLDPDRRRPASAAACRYAWTTSRRATSTSLA